MKVDFFARRPHFVDHLAPVWAATRPEIRGPLYVSAYLKEYAEVRGLDVTPIEAVTRDSLSGAPDGGNPMVVCAYGDMQACYRLRPQRTFIMMEHGVGLTFNHPGYAGGLGLRRRVALFLAPNEFIRAKTAKVLPLAPQVVIGTPKLDGWVREEIASSPSAPRNDRSVVCISFHWNGAHVAAEAGNAFAHYAEILPELARDERFTLIGHGHPKILQKLRPTYEAAGMEVVDDFCEVMERADLYVNDASSTLYEFLVTGKPVVILNAPWFRRYIHFGLRFWDYTDVGPQVEQPEQLRETIVDTLANPEPWRQAREKAVRDLYPNLGCAAQKAAEAIEQFLFWNGQIHGRRS